MITNVSSNITPNTPYPSNFRRVDDTVMRSAQPTRAEIIFLKNKENLTDIINFRTLIEPKTDFNEEELAKQLDINYHHLPTSSRYPKIEQAREFLKTVHKIKQNPKAQVLLHCRAGADRTGMYVMLYELKYQVKNLNAAIREMLEMGHNQKLYPTMIKKTASFARILGFLK